MKFVGQQVLSGLSVEPEFMVYLSNNDLKNMEVPGSRMKGLPNLSYEIEKWLDENASLGWGYSHGGYVILYSEEDVMAFILSWNEDQ